MAFLAIDGQKILFTLQKNQMQFDLSLVGGRLLTITKQMGNMQKSEGDYENDPNYIEMEVNQEYLESQKQCIESQIAILEANIKSAQDLVKNGIKAECGLNLTGG
jgi:hypothetical protein